MSNPQTPAISVIVPTKNREGMVRTAIESLLAQTIREWEAIIVDDVSEPAELEAIRDHASVDSRLRFIVRETTPAGGNHCRNIGAVAARADLLVFFDSDDALSPNCLESRVRVMRQNPELDFAVFPHRPFLNIPGDCDLTYSVDSLEDPLDRFLRFDIPWQTAGPIWRKKSFERLGGWDERLPSIQDWDLHVRALASGFQFAVLREPTFSHRMALNNPNSVSARSKGPRFIRGRELAYSNVAIFLERKELLTPHRRLLFARLFLILAERWALLKEDTEAQRVWAECLNRRWINESQYRQGLRLLRLWQGRWRRGAYRRYLRLRWPAELRQDYSP